MPGNKFQRKLHLQSWMSAVAILVLFSSALYLFFSSGKKSAPIVRTKEQLHLIDNNIPPGRNKATLTLNDGTTINLDSVKSGMLARQGNIKIVKGGNGTLVYHVDQQNSKEAGYNTISVPRGGRYEIVLSDGSKVWLNAASSLRFPTSFKGKIRNVALTGEGYFEVTKNASMPFNVTVNDMTVEVLGTHFNINAYSDEHSIATTLLEGSVKVRNGAPGAAEFQSIQLKPGEQADLAADGKLKMNRQVNLGQVVAWKDNYFEFNNTAVPAMMRQISRWYDVDVQYKDSIPTRRLTGKFSRSVNLGQLTEMLRYTGMNMKVENKMILIGETEIKN